MGAYALNEFTLFYLDSDSHVSRGKGIHLVKDVSSRSGREVPTHVFNQMASERQVKALPRSDPPPWPAFRGSLY